MKKVLKNVKGITLIALVITIIVLLILAGITINMISSQDGILNKAVTAKEATEKAKEKENEILEEQKIEMAIYANEGSASKWDGSIAESFSKGDGTADNPYEISNGSELAYLAKQVNEGNDFEGKVLKMTNDIDLQNKEWTPIGGGIESSLLSKEDTVLKEFKGELDGSNKIIYGLNINQEDNALVGLVGNLGANGKIKDVIVGSGKVNGAVIIGGIAGGSEGTIEGCRNYASITSIDNVNKSQTGEQAGGIVGQAGGTIKNCINKGNVLTKDECGKTSRGKIAGGIVACTTDSSLEITDCKNYGKVVSQYQQAGGIIASFQFGTSLSVVRCENYGDVSTEPVNDTLNSNIAGGIIGWIMNGNVVIKECVNSGNITAKLNSAGGIVGVMNVGNIENCINEGEVIAGCQQAGGITGAIADGLVTGCINKGNVKSCSIGGRGIAGGIVGWQGYNNKKGGKVEKCYNTGKISSGNYNDATQEATGGIIGLLSSEGIVEYCYSSCEFENEEAVGEIVGQWNTNSTASVNNCYYTNATIKGIGSKGTDNTKITAQDDETGITEKVDMISSFDNFKKWLTNKFPSLTF